MTGPLQSAAQFARLERYRSELKVVGQEADHLNRSRLLLTVSRFEAFRSSFFSWDEELDSTRVERTLLCILDWSKAPASLTAEDLLELHAAVAACSSPEPWRRDQARPLFGRHPTLAPELVTRALRRFVGWVGSEGFGEIHPVEQSTVCQLRLLEICPFSELSHTVSVVFSYYFLVAAGYLLPSFEDADAKRYRAAMLEGLDFSTSSLVELHLEACLRSYEQLENFSPDS